MDLYISDLDGTLLNCRQEICSESVEIINELIDAGLNFTIATARAWDSAKDILAPLKLKLPVILSNGAFVYDFVNNVNIKANIIDSCMFDTVLAACRELELQPLVFAVNGSGENKLYYKDIQNSCIENFIRERKDKGDKRLAHIDDYDICRNDKVYSFAFGVEENRVEQLCRDFKCRLDLLVHYHEDVYIKGFYWLEIAHKMAGKNYAVKFLKKYLGAKRVICFGDNLNDCSMFETADVGCAVSNANEGLKKLAAEIIGSNDENGVARYLKSVFEK